MTTYDYIEVMKTVKIADLKSHLSAYLKEVRSGHELIVADRDTPVARISPIPREREKLQVRKALRPWATVRDIKGVKLAKPVDPLDALLEERSRG